MEVKTPKSTTITSKAKSTVSMKFKKLLKGIFIFFLLLIVLVISIPYFFKDQIAEKVKSDINNSINANLDFSEVDLSLIRSFPDFSFRMTDFKLEGIDQFEGTSLAAADQVSFSLDVMSVINTEAPIEINSVQLVKPDVDIIVLKDGTSNYDISKVDPDAPAIESGDYNFLIQLKEYSISEGNFTYDDRVNQVFTELNNINHTGKGDFTQDVFDLITKTQIDKITVKSGGIQYINKAKGELDITLHSDFPNMKFTLKENELQINELALKADGYLEIKGDDINMDFNFDAPRNTFKSFLSLIPNAYTKDFAQIKTDGKLKLNGTVKGTYNETSLPAFNLNLDVDNAFFQYPGLPMGVSDIFAKAKINSPSSNLDKMVIDVTKFKMKLGNNPLLGRLKLKTPMSDPDIDTRIKGTLNFADLAKAFPMEGVESLSGSMKADVEADARLSSIEQEDYESVDMKGFLQFSKLSYKADGMPAVLIDALDMNFTPRQVNIEKFVSKLGKSDLRATGSIDNILAYISPNKTMRGKLNIRSNYFNADEWMASPTETPTTVTASATPVEVFDRFDFDITGRINKLDYDVYDLKNIVVDGNATSNKISIDNFQLDIGSSDLQGSGTITNVFNYLYKNETLGGDLAVNSDLFDLNEFMVEVPEQDGKVKAQKISNTESVGPILIPDNVNINLDAKIKQVKYTNLNLNNVRGNIKVRDNKAELKNCVANLFKGEMEMDGKYDTSDPKKPAFNLDYQIKQWDFQNAFTKLNTFQKIAPIGEFISGRFNSKFSFSGLLGDDMFPDISTLSADGFFHTLNGAVKSFGPLEKLSNKLNIAAFNNLNLKDTRNWFDIKDGRVELQEFNYKYDDIDMLISGSHGFDTDMDYKILAKIPRELWANNAAGKAADKGLGFLKKEAGKLGVNVDLGDFIDVQINILGTMKNPKIKIKPLGSGGKSLKDTAKDIVDDVVTEAKEKVKEKVDEVKTDVKEKVDNKKAELTKKANAEVKKIMDKANLQAKKIKAEAKKLSDKTKLEGYKQADKLVSDAGKNPIKKMAAKKAADVLKKETDKKAKKIVVEGDKRAKQVVDNARKQADKTKKQILGG